MPSLGYRAVCPSLYRDTPTWPSAQCAPQRHGCFLNESIAYCSDYVWQSSNSMKVPLNLYLFDSSVWEFDVPWVTNWERTTYRGLGHTRSVSNLPLKGSCSKNVPKIQGWGGPGCVVELGLIGVSLWSCGSSKLHICSSTVLGNLNCDVSQECKFGLSFGRDTSQQPHPQPTKGKKKRK